MRVDGITCGMKVAVSIPDDIFAEAEALAKRLKATRSDIYSRALGEFVGHHSAEQVTERMNEVMDDVGESARSAESADSFTAVAAHRVLRNVEW